MKEVIIIGGGPSGLFSSFFAANKYFHVTVIDKNKDVLKKLLLTGNGKCNFWNKDQNLQHFHSNNQEVLDKIFNEENVECAYDYLLKMGIVPICMENYIYPYSMQSFTMKHAFLEEAKFNNIDFLLETEVLSVEKKKNKFEVSTSKGNYIADAVVLATGSKAYPKTGSDGKGYEIAYSMGHDIIKVEPSLVGLSMDCNYLNEWAGVRSHVKVSYKEKSEEGEIQLTKNGISGICTFNISREVARDLSFGKKPVVSINFLPFTNDTEKFLEDQNRKVNNRNIGNILEAILNYKIVNVLLKECNIKRDSFYDDLSEKQKKRLVMVLSNFSCKIVDTFGYESGQVCSGGIPLSEIKLESMESKIVEGLFFAGEILDIDGDCGGYNLENAFISGMIAGKGVKNFFIHTMRLVDFAFDKIKKGEKSIEIRLNDEKRRRIKEGDLISFENISTHEKLLTQVIFLHHFDSFQELFDSLDKKPLGLNEEDNYEIMNQFYSQEEQNCYGALGIEIKKL